MGDKRLLKQQSVRFVLVILIVLLASACSLTSAEPTSTAPEISGAPVVRIASPAANATYIEGVPVKISARIENAGPDIDRVEVTLDQVIIGTASSPNSAGTTVFTVEQEWTSVLGQHTIGVTAFRGDGTSSTPQQVTINVVTQPGQNTNTTTDTQPQAAASATNVPSGPPPTSSGGTSNTNTTTNPTQPSLPTPVPVQPSATTPPQPTKAPASPTPSKPTGRITVGVNVRGGPSVSFDPPIGSLPADANVDLLGINPAGDWYKISFWNGEGWVYSTYVATSGDTSRLPVDPGPPTPLPPTPTSPPPPTSPPVNVNLVPVNIQTVPHPLQCGKASEIQITLRNDGSEATTSGGMIRVYSILVSSGAVLEETSTAYGPLGPGQQVTVSAFLTVSVNYGEQQKIIIELDSNNQVTESNETDNRREDVPYVLQKAGCP